MYISNVSLNSLTLILKEHCMRCVCNVHGMVEKRLLALMYKAEHILSHCLYLLHFVILCKSSKKILV